jgi:threonine/homoserine/homoserine lactone efflux protein
MDKTTVYELLGFLLAFLGIGIGYYAVHFGIGLERTKRELEHKERMRARELGRSLPGDGSWLSPLRVGFAIALGVPVAAFGFATLSTQAVGYHADIWQAAGMVSIFSVVCGSVVVCLSAARQARPEREHVAQEEKSQVEEDAYDVVSARG